MLLAADNSGFSFPMIVSLLGGLALFLYGMEQMTAALEEGRTSPRWVSANHTARTCRRVSGLCRQRSTVGVADAGPLPSRSGPLFATFARRPAFSQQTQST